MNRLKHHYLPGFILLLVLVIGFLPAGAQGIKINRIDPPNWWAGMKNQELQLLVYGEHISGSEVSFEYPGVKLKETIRLENPDYVFLNLQFTNEAMPGSFQIKFTSGKKSETYSYELKKRISRIYNGLNSGDVLYLIMPDRFANGDKTNDNAAGMYEKHDRQNPSGKHGGDLQGIINHIDYIRNLGVTAVWLNPVFENNMHAYSYHGYSITDHYKVDPRYGTNELYFDFVNKCHETALKVVKDMIFNHCGSEHWWMNNLPSQDWLNQWPEYTQTNYTNAVSSDPHASAADYRKLVDGWFVKSMPDLNQRNTYLATYLIQNSIWWIESAGIDGIRMDTYPYPDKDMMTTWVDRVLEEYPGFYIVGETWLHSPAYESYWQGGSANFDGYDSHLPGISDFPVHYAVINTFRKGGSVGNLYDVISKDLVYSNPDMNKIFMDNHDMDRVYAQLGQDLDKLKMATVFILTTRGIPQIFYGTELLMKGTGDHGVIREDFPGGWPGDARNAFSQKGRTADENAYFNFIQKILQWRKNNHAVENGRLIHFIPEDEIYVYSKYSDKSAYVVIINNNSAAKTVATNRYRELFDGYTNAMEIISGTIVTDLTQVEVGPYSGIILDLSK
ncbi:MAG: glycoside hydrolase family 13 protein [Bacteroidetes bacterium]|nr:glycoside hydrolase family 13 protein [Bacteroidota bacterium]